MYVLCRSIYQYQYTDTFPLYVQQLFANNLTVTTYNAIIYQSFVSVSISIKMYFENRETESSFMHIKIDFSHDLGLEDIYKDLEISHHH